MLDANRTKGGFADLLGYELAEWGEDHAVVTLKVDQRHMNRSGVMHGGVLSTLLDTALGYVGTYTPEGETPKRAFTLSLNCHFIGTVKKGATLTATARLAEPSDPDSLRGHLWLENQEDTGARPGQLLRGPHAAGGG